MSKKKLTETPKTGPKTVLAEKLKKASEIKIPPEVGRSRKEHIGLQIRGIDTHIGILQNRKKSLEADLKKL